MKWNRWALRRGLKRALASAGKTMSARKDRVVVFCYHSVHARKWFASATPESFKQHLSWLRENCHCVPFEDILDHRRRGPVEVPVVSLTFDDGFADNHEFAFPLLREFDLPATFFITAGLIEGDHTVLGWFQRLFNCEAEDIQPLTWEQLREMRDAGMQIGCHSYSHPNLAALKSQEIEAELSRAREIIERSLEVDVSSLAYPFGQLRAHVTEHVRTVARSCGYRSAAIVQYREVRSGDDPLAVPRFFVSRGDVAVIQGKVRGAFDVVGTWQRYVPLWLGRLTNPEYFSVADPRGPQHLRQLR